MGPTLAGFVTFLRDVVGLDPLVLPDNSPAIPMAYNVAGGLVNQAIFSVGCGPGFTADPTQPSLYAYAIYNLAADRVINYAPDQAGRTDLKDLRQNYSINQFVPGVTSSSSDQGTAQSRLNTEAMKNFTMRDLQTLKTPYGRAYMEIAQDYGPNIWGFS